MSIVAIIPEATTQYTPLTTSDEAMMMALPPCCRGGGCSNMTGSMSSSTMDGHFHETTAVAQAADSIGLTKHTQAALNSRFTSEFGKKSARAIFATFVAELMVEPRKQLAADVRAINQEYSSLA